MTPNVFQWLRQFQNRAANTDLPSNCISCVLEMCLHHRRKFPGFDLHLHLQTCRENKVFKSCGGWSPFKKTSLTNCNAQKFVFACFVCTLLLPFNTCLLYLLCLLACLHCLEVLIAETQCFENVRRRAATSERSGRRAATSEFEFVFIMCVFQWHNHLFLNLRNLDFAL